MIDYFIGACIGLICGIIGSVTIASSAGVTEGKMRAARDGGFSIGSGVLEQQWHCAPITKHVGIESAKAQVLINQNLGEKL